jgi:hypothetical protein
MACADVCEDCALASCSPRLVRILAGPGGADLPCKSVRGPGQIPLEPVIDEDGLGRVVATGRGAGRPSMAGTPMRVGL